MIIHIREIIFHDFGVGEVRAPTNLGKPRYSRSYVMTAMKFSRVLFHDRRQLRARADDAHVSQKHIQKIGQFVDRCAPQERSYSGQSRLKLSPRGENELIPVLYFVSGGLGGVSHRSELEHREPPSIAADPLLAKERRTSEFQYCCSRTDGNQEQGRGS